MAEIQDFLKPFQFHGIEFSVKNDEAMGQCPFCGREKKFSVNKTTGQWRCFVCAEKGNVYSFLSLLWEKSPYVNDGLTKLRENRGILRESTVHQAGLRESPVTGEYILPGYNAEGKLVTLYKYAKAERKLRLMPTAEVGHALFQMEEPNKTKDREWVYLLEKPWDAMVLWEMLGSLKKLDDGSLVPTANRSLSLLADVTVLSTHSCNVFDPKWSSRFEGKKVAILFDNDHPGVHPKTKQDTPAAAFEGMKRVAQLLCRHEVPPKEIHYLCWGPNGYDKKQKSGLDVRDLLMQGGDNVKGRIPVVKQLIGSIKPVPPSTLPGRDEVAAKSGSTEMELKLCHEWKKLIAGWKKTFKWTPGLNRGLATMLAVITSTKAKGDQIWAKIMGPPGSGKSAFCEALTTARRYVVAKSTIRGFHSGYKSDKSGTEDNSLLAQLYDKTLITKDGDTLLSSENLSQILSEARDIYDSTSRTHYRNAISRQYEGVRMTWLLCGTASLRQLDDTELGARFLDCILMDEIDEELEWEIVLRKAHAANRDVKLESGSGMEGMSNPEMTNAMQLTGGYVEYLRANANSLLDKVKMSDENLTRCAQLAIFTAYIRARPSSRQKEKAERELGTRLVSQFIRLANCLAVVMNTVDDQGEPAVTEEVMEMVKATALDTAKGRTMELIRYLYDIGSKGMETKALAISTGETEQNERDMLKFLKKIGAVEYFTLQVTSGLRSAPRWRLTDKMRSLYQTIICPENVE